MAHYLALIALSFCGNLFKWKWIKINLGSKLLLIWVPVSALAAGCPGSRPQIGLLKHAWRAGWTDLLCAWGAKHRAQVSLLITLPLSQFFIWIINDQNTLLLSCYCLTSRLASWSKWNEIWHFLSLLTQVIGYTEHQHAPQVRRVVPTFDQISYSKCHPLVFWQEIHFSINLFDYVGKRGWCNRFKIIS